MLKKARDVLNENGGLTLSLFSLPALQVMLPTFIRTAISQKRREEK